MRKFIFILILLLYAPAAEAVRIKNVDDIPYDIEIISFGKKKNITIEAGKAYQTRTKGLYIVIPGKKEVKTRINHEYMIKDGLLHLQRHNYMNSRD